MIIIDDSEELESLIQDIKKEEFVLVVPILTDHQIHPSINKISCIYVYSSNEIEKFTNIFINKVTNNLENFHYNIIVANLHQMCSFLTKEIGESYKKETLIENYKKILFRTLYRSFVF